MFHHTRRYWPLLVLALAASQAQAADSGPVYGPELQGFTYPFPVGHFQFSSQGQELDMAYLDVAPTGTPNGKTALLLHGKNFCGATWEATIKAFNTAGYRVIAPDQVGFCASTKPAHYQYTFQQLATNTEALLKQLGVTRAVVVGHSTGGMLATRFALMFPQTVEHLVMVNPIGLEDWKALGVPYRSVDQWYARELNITAASIESYEKSTYYNHRWKPEYSRWVDMLAGLNRGPGQQRVAWNSALIYDMIYSQPVIYEFPLLTMPTLLLIGDADTTAIGSDMASASLKARLGNYKVLGRKAVLQLRQGRLIEFPGLGHAPQMEDPEKFHQVLLDALRE